MTQLRNSTWQARTQQAAQEKKKTEETTYGVKISLMHFDFFVSEDVIPEKCKIYEDGILKKFNLKGVSKSDLVVKEILKKRPAQPEDKSADISDIKESMGALFRILHFDISKNSEVENYIYKSAILGALGCLFTALIENSVFNDVINDHFKRKLRNTLYHYRWVHFQSITATRMLAAHFYEHCRHELSACHVFPSVEKLIENSSILDPKFVNMIICVFDNHRVAEEWQDSMIEELLACKKKFNEIITFCKENPAIHSTGSFPKETALAIRNHAIGVHLARLGGGATTLLRNEAICTDEKGELTMAILTDQDKENVEHNFGKFIQPGNLFRHNKIHFPAMLKMFGVSILVPKKHVLSESKDILLAKQQSKQTGAVAVEQKADKKASVARKR